MIIEEFPAVRPQAHLVQQVATLPYDTMSEQEAVSLTNSNPLSFLKVLKSNQFRGKVDSAIEYRHSRKKFESLCHDEIFISEAPSIYIYQLQSESHIQSGIMACCSIEEYQNNTIKPHENIRIEKALDRILHITHVGVDAGPVMLTFADSAGVKKLIKDEMLKPSLYEFSSSDNVIHRIWKVLDPTQIKNAMKKIPNAYIADGHHRLYASSRCYQEIISKQLDRQGYDDYKLFQAVLFPHDELKILPYNRAIQARKSLSIDEVKEALKENFSVRQIDTDKTISPAKHNFAMYTKEGWFELISNFNPSASVLSDNKPDVEILHNYILEPVFGIMDESLDENIQFLGGSDSTKKLIELVNSGQASHAFVLNPTTIDELILKADQGNNFFPKYTWFEPKVRSGIIVYSHSKIAGSLIQANKGLEILI